VREYTDAFDNGALGLVSAAQWTDLLEASERAQRARADNLVEGSTSDVSDATAFPADADFAAYDAGRFSKWSMAGNDMWATPIDPNIYGPVGVLAGVRRWQHDVEKGLSMPSIRSEFSVASGMLMRLRAFSEAALGSRSSSEVGEGALGKQAAPSAAIALGGVVGSLEQYALLHERSGQAIPEEASGTIALLLEGGVDATEGGVRQVRAVDIFSSIGFRGGVEDNVATAVVDLAPFFESRHSIREFSNRRAESGLIVEAVRRAHEASPSVCNRQSSRVYVLSSDEAKNFALSHQTGNRGWGHTASHVLILTSSLEHFIAQAERYQGWIDGGMFAQSLLLAIHSVGLAACPLNWDVPRASDEALRERLRIPESDTITMMMAVGHYAEEFTHAVSPRKPLREVLIPEEAVWKADI